jgi:Spy/CpxP family protein refolding chaperone
MTRKWMALAAAGAAIVVGGALVVRAQNMGPRPAMGMGNWSQRGGELPMANRALALLDNSRVRAALNLTDAQASQLRKIIVGMEESSIKTQADVAVAGIELRELLREDKPDHEAVMNKVSQIAQLRAQLMKQHVEALLAAKDVLTPEQQKMIRQFIESHAMAGPPAPPGHGKR